ncbi:hypothetical protein, partial [Burkholderia ubonensis]|uniref:hypothetical protein n=1 Tax=Burkholderia ubonensis TaxID=101571 RepID=UPI001E5006A0
EPASIPRSKHDISKWPEHDISKKLLHDLTLINHLMSNNKYHLDSMHQQFIVANSTKRPLPVVAGVVTLHAGPVSSDLETFQKTAARTPATLLICNTRRTKGS